MPENAEVAGLQNTAVDHTHPLYLQASDVPGVVLIPIKLTGPENYGLWSRSMRMALLGKGKLGFIDGSCVRSMYTGYLAKLWDKCNAIVLSWIGSTVATELMPSIIYAGNAKKIWADFKARFDRSNLTRIYHLVSEIVTTKQGIDSVTSYYTKLKDLWDELDVIVPRPSCDCEESGPYLEHLEQQRLLQFLMGLNESYSNVRSNVLLKSPVPSVNEAYAVVIQDESQRTLGVVDGNKDPLALLAGKGKMFKPRRNFDVPCDHCGCKGHPSEECYTQVGFPEDFKSKRVSDDDFKNKKGGGNVFKGKRKSGNNKNGGNRAYANNASASDDGTGSSNAAGSSQGMYLTDEQYNHLKGLLYKSNAGSEYSANFVGITSLMSSASVSSWIIDSGASHHITFDKGLLHDIKKLEVAKDNGIQLPTGNRCKIEHTGQVKLLGDKSVKDVLHTPDFRFNLLSVSKLTRDLQCSVIFYPDYCVFQELCSGKVLGIGELSNDLYVLKKGAVALSAERSSLQDTETVLWHHRLGHASATSIKQIPSLRNAIRAEDVQSCTICPLAKQCRHTCSACFKQYKKKGHLIDHIQTSHHSVHDPKCGVCNKHCKSFESLKEHIAGPSSKVNCSSIFEERGCRLCLKICSTVDTLHEHKETCRLTAPPPIDTVEMLNSEYEMDIGNENGGIIRVEAVGIDCEMVGGGSDGSLDLCARVCLVDEDERLIFHTYVQPELPVTDYRYEITGITEEDLRDAMPLDEVRERILQILYNRESIGRVRAKVLVGHNPESHLNCLKMVYPDHLLRDTAKYFPLMKTNCDLSKRKNCASHSLKDLTKTYLGYDIQVGHHDPYQDSVSVMRLYKRVRSQDHQVERTPRVSTSPLQFDPWKSVGMGEGITIDELLKKSRSNYRCWCLDSRDPVHG